MLLRLSWHSKFASKGILTCDSSAASNSKPPVRDRHEIGTPFATKAKSGAVRLIASWKIPATAKSGPELMQVAFLTENVVSIKRAAGGR